MEIKKVTIENFRNISSLVADFSSKTIISGKNRTGKSTIRDAILWLMQDKLADGSSAVNIRPKDNNGKDIDYLEIKVSLDIVHDSNDYVLTKIQKQKWVKKRGSEDSIFDGNVNEYEINGIPKKMKDFNAFINEIVDPDTLLYGVNANAFLGLDTKKRRAKLLSLEPEFSDADVIALDDDFKEIESDLNVGTIDELLSREKKTKKSLTETLKSIPVRIDEVSKRKSEIDSDELLECKAQFEAKVQSFTDIRAKAVEEQNARNAIQTRCMEIVLEQTRIVNEANKDVSKKRKEVTDSINSNKGRISEQAAHVEQLRTHIEMKQMSIANIKKIGADLNKQFKAVKEQLFDEKSRLCPTCGQELPVQKIIDLKRKFEQEKEDKLNKITLDAKNYKRDMLEIDAEKNDLEAQLEAVEMSISVLKKGLSELEEQLKALPEETAGENIPAWVKLKEENDRLDAELAKPFEYPKLGDIDSDIANAQKEIQRIDFELSNNESKNADINDRIEELNEERVAVSQSIANTERKIDILERFNKAKIELLTDKVNQHFKTVKWQMFEPQINGGYAMVCNPTVDGISYFGGLNHGDRLLADLDICCAWQNASNVKLPVFLDDAESVDADRIPTLDRQLIVLRRTDDPKLMITGV